MGYYTEYTLTVIIEEEDEGKYSEKDIIAH